MKLAEVAFGHFPAHPPAERLDRSKKSHRKAVTEVSPGRPLVPGRSVELEPSGEDL
jgi:hypothetical protein